MLTEEEADRIGSEAQEFMEDKFPNAIPASLHAEPRTDRLDATIAGWRQGFIAGWLGAYEKYVTNRE